ncbi:MAG: glycosyltransferase family 1 protein, partial [Desulfovibrio sp.]|nr:glycosyltransferase family 1 protein [Desulfovibrio sp.]
MHILAVGGGMLVRALRRLGHSVLYVAPFGTPDIVCDHPLYSHVLLRYVNEKGFRPDVLFYTDDGNFPFLLNPQILPFPSVFYSIDTYCNPWHVPYAFGFDYVLAAQKDFVSLFTKEGYKASWLPLFCQEEVLLQEETKRDVPVCFVGTLGHKNNPDRLPFIEAFRQKQPLVVHQGDYVPLFSRSQIVLNQTAFSEVNFRCFEAMALGAALLMERCQNGMDELFAPDERLPLYTRGNANEAAEIAKTYLADPLRLASIAKKGLACVAKRHTDTCRATFLSSLFSELLENGCQKGRLTHEQAKREAIVNGAFGVLAADLLNSPMASYADFFASMARGKALKKRQ